MAWEQGLWGNSEDVWLLADSVERKFFLLDRFQLFLEYYLLGSSVVRCIRSLEHKQDKTLIKETITYMCAVIADIENQVHEDTVNGTGVFAGMIMQISTE